MTRIPSIEALVPSWVLDLRAENKSPATIEAYTYATTQFRDYLVARGMPTEVERITGEYVSAFLADLLRIPFRGHRRDPVSRPAPVLRVVRVRG